MRLKHGRGRRWRAAWAWTRCIAVLAILGAGAASEARKPGAKAPPGIPVGQHLVLQRLDKPHLKQAMRLVSNVFSDPGAGYDLRRCFYHPEGHREHETGAKVRSVRDWVLVDQRTDKVVGTVGLYQRRGEQDAYWLNWYSLDPGYRGQGLGGKLLKHAIGEARRDGVGYLRLFTGDDPTEGAAQRVYEKHGLKVYKTEPWPGTPYHYLFRQLDLRAAAR